MKRSAKIAALRDISSQEPINYCQFVINLRKVQVKSAKFVKK